MKTSSTAPVSLPPPLRDLVERLIAARTGR